MRESESGYFDGIGELVTIVMISGHCFGGTGELRGNL